MSMFKEEVSQTEPAQTRRRPALLRWFQSNTFAPPFFPETFSRPLISYLIAALLPIISVILLLGVKNIFHTNRFPNDILILVITLVAFGWGAGPSLFALLIGAILLITFVYTSFITAHVYHFYDVIELVEYCLAGGVISVFASQIERARRGAETLSRRLNTIIDIIPDSLSVHDAQGRVVRINRVTRHTSPLTSARTIPATLTEYAAYLPNGEPFPPANRPVARALHGEAPRNIEMVYHLPNGQERIAITRAAPFYNAQGAIEGVVTISHDITELRQAEREILVRNQQLEAIFEAMTDGVNVYDRDGKILRMNSAYKRFIGLDSYPEYIVLSQDERAESLQVRDEFQHPMRAEQRPVHRMLNGELLTGNNTVDILLRSFDGRDVQLNISGTATYDDAGKISGGVLVFRDVTERRRMEQAIIEYTHQLESALAQVHVSERRFRGLFESNIIGLILAGNSTIFDANDAFLTMLGYTRDEMRTGGLDWYAITPAEYYEVSEQRVHELLERGECIPFEKEYVHKDGHRVPVLIGAALIEQKPQQWVSFVLDLTESKRLEQRTRQSLDALLAMAQLIVQPTQGHSSLRETLYQLALLVCHVLDCEHVGITRVDPHTQLLQPMVALGFSPEMERHWFHESVAYHLDDYVSSSSLADLHAGKVVLYDRNKELSTHAHLPAYGDGLIMLVPMCMQDALIGLLVLDYQSTEHEYTDEEQVIASAAARLITTVLEREQLLREYTEAAASTLALQETNRRMDEFISIASHELRTPLTTIRVSLQLAARQMQRLNKVITEQEQISQRPAQQIQEHIARAERQVEFQNRLINDLVDVSRIHAEQLEFEMVDTDLLSLTREVVQEQQQVAETRTIHLLLPAIENLHVCIDAHRIEQVMMNYLTNALKYSLPERPVTVQIAIEERFARFSVSDEGPGLAPEVQERIWTRFYRVPGVNVQSGSGVGLGLGLYICRSIIEYHHGQVGVISEQGQGATFWFTLPFAPSV